MAMAPIQNVNSVGFVGTTTSPAKKMRDRRKKIKNSDKYYSGYLKK